MNNNDYLTHHGILGMKWGVRRYQNKDGTLTPTGKKRIKKKIDPIKRDMDDFKPYQKTGIKTKKGKMVISPKEVKEIMKSQKDLAKKIEKKTIDKWSSKTRTNNLYEKSSFLEKLTYDKATFKRIDKLIQNKNMSELEATKRAKGEAWINSALITLGAAAFIAKNRK